MDDDYVVCSDETGVWNGDSDLYMRVFAIFKKNELNKFNEAYSKLKESKKKHSNNLGRLIKIINEENIEVQFYSGFNFVKELRPGTEAAENMIDDIRFPRLALLDDEVAKRSLKAAFNNIYYLYYIEYHIFLGLKEDFINHNGNVEKFVIERPQFTRQIFESFFNQIFEDIELELVAKNNGKKNEAGTQLCDRIGAFYRKELGFDNAKRNKRVPNDAKEWILERLLEPKHHAKCNPMKVFYNAEADRNAEWSDDLKTKKWNPKN